MSSIEEELEDLSNDWELKYLDLDEQNDSLFRYVVQLKREELILRVCIPEYYPDEPPVVKLDETQMLVTNKQLREKALSKAVELGLTKRGQPVMRLISDKLWEQLQVDAHELSPEKTVELCSCAKSAVKSDVGRKKKKKTKYSLLYRFGDLEIKRTVFQKSPMKNSRNSVSVTEEKAHRMRTARDVIKRFKWDEKLKYENFVIGYLDRFNGIIECPLWDLNWEDDIASTGPADKLAIPEHRIQYFKWNSKVIWSKRDKIDHVFGSTGGKADLVELIARQNMEVQSTEKSNGSVPDLKSENIPSDTDNFECCDNLAYSSSSKNEADVETFQEKQMTEKTAVGYNHEEEKL